MGARHLWMAMLLAAPGHAAPWLDLSGSQRSRLEVLGGDLRADRVADQSALFLRTTLAARIGPGPVQLNAELWDSRAYALAARTPFTTGEINPLEPVVANVSADLKGLGLVDAGHARLTMGRMIANIGSRRLVGAEDYRNTISASTGVRLDFGNKGWDSTLIWLLPQQRLPNTADRLRDHAVVLDRERLNLAIWGGLLTWHRPGFDIDVNAYRLAEHDAPGLPTKDRRLNTLGGRLFAPHQPKGGWDGELEAAWQWGEARRSTAASAPLLPVDAWFFHGDLGHSWSGRWHPRLAVLVDGVSGDRPGGTIRRFDTLFGIRRPDFSLGSLLTVIGRANLLAVGVKGEVADKENDAFVSVRPMWAESCFDQFSQSGATDASGQSGRFAGWEFDSRVRHWLVHDRLRLELNGVLFARRGLTRFAPGLRPGSLISYGSVTVQASF